MSAAANTEQFDAIIIGSGLTGLHQLYALRELGLKVQAYEAGGGVGGTWYWNRYPGCRFDSESYAYSYAFSDELLQEWDWKELFSSQPETERYLNYVADKFELRQHIQLNTRIVAASYDEAARQWEIVKEDGGTARAQFLITAIGILSVPYFVMDKGLDDFKGDWYHTGLWPEEPVDFDGKKVVVLGTGASAVQLIPEIAKVCGSLTVFQRTPNFCLPIRNKEIDPEFQADIKRRYPEIFALCRTTVTGQVYSTDPRSALEVSEEERLETFERLWALPGFAKWLANFQDIATDYDAAETMAEFVRGKIRERVNDPAVAEKLCPRDHAFGAKRIPLETGYYEAYNRPNVTLVDLHETPFKQIVANGVETTDEFFEADIIVFATGFDAVTGAFDKIDIRGRGGRALKDKWEDGPRTYLGLMGTGFPNLFTAVGPHNGASTCNVPRCSEHNVGWICDCISYMHGRDYSLVEPAPAAEDEWTEHANACAVGNLVYDRETGEPIANWFFGTNVEGKRAGILGYLGGAAAYREKCDAVVEEGYRGFVFE